MVKYWERGLCIWVTVVIYCVQHQDPIWLVGLKHDLVDIIYSEPYIQIAHLTQCPIRLSICSWHSCSTIESGGKRALTCQRLG